MKRIFLTAMLALVSSAAFATPPSAKASDLQLIKQLAMQPFAAVVEDRCEIRGAVWMNGPQVGINIEIINGAGETFKGQTGASGIYSISVPYNGTPLRFVERISDPIYVRDDVAKTARIFQPTIACDHQSQPQA